MRNWRRNLAALFTLVFLLSLAAPADARRHRRRRNRVLPVQVQKVTIGRLGRSVNATGTLLPKSEVRLMSRAEGQVVEVLAREGDRVIKGQLLARLDATLKRIELALAQSELEAARAKLKKFEAGNLPEEIAAAEAAVEQAGATLKRNQAELESAKARLQEADANRRSLEALHKSGVISVQEWRKVSTEANRASADVSERQARLAEDAARLRAARERLKLVRIGARPEDIAVAKAEVTKRLQEVRKLWVQIEYFGVRSPIAGVLTERKIEPGDLATNRSHLFTLVQTSVLKAQVRVSELDLSKVKKGQGARIELDAYRGQIFRGKVTRVFPSVDPKARQVIVEVDIKNEKLFLRPGLLARVRFEPLLGRRAINLPVHAVVWDGDTRNKIGYVFVVKPMKGGPKKRGGPARAARRSPKGAGVAEANMRGARRGARRGRSGRGASRFRAVRRDVRLGEMIDGRIEILKGLRVGERVVVSATNRLKDGSAIRVVSP